MHGPAYTFFQQEAWVRLSWVRYPRHSLALLPLFVMLTVFSFTMNLTLFMFFCRQLQETQMSVATKLGEAEHKIQQLQSGWCIITVTLEYPKLSMSFWAMYQILLTAFWKINKHTEPNFLRNPSMVSEFQ